MRFGLAVTMACLAVGGGSNMSGPMPDISVRPGDRPSSSERRGFAFHRGIEGVDIVAMRKKNARRKRRR
jgi:hypothetical protein